MTRRALLLALLVGVVVPWQDAVAKATRDQVEGAARFVDWLAAEAIAVLRRKSDSLEQREAALRQLLVQAFDVAFIGRFVLGRYWRKMSAEEREDYLAVFSEFIVKTYSRRLGGYSGEAFTITGAKPAGKKDIMVKTNIERPSGPPIKAHWRLRVIDRQYRIIDVSVEGVSMALTQRAEFAAVMRNHGMPGLLQALRLRSQSYGAKAAS
jgi:phospholipid transport system substrate-binding protein